MRRRLENDKDGAAGAGNVSEGPDVDVEVNVIGHYSFRYSFQGFLQHFTMEYISYQH